jgi:hypothetical protein
MHIAPFLALLALHSPAQAKSKKSEPAPAPPPAAEPAPAPVEETPPPTPEEAAPTHVHNADMSVTFGRQDGSSKALKVTGIERSTDFYGDEGWSSDESNLKITVEVGSTEKQVGWKDVKSVTVTPGKMDDVDCTYSSDFTPWMYECTLKTTTNIVLKDGTKGTVDNRNKWRFTLDDGSQIEFWLYKHTERMQDDMESDGSGDAEENTKMYPRLQELLRADIKGSMVKSVAVN